MIEMTVAEFVLLILFSLAAGVGVGARTVYGQNERAR